jgi:DNA modification methylase
MAIKDKKITDNYAIYNGDCIEAMADMPDKSMHMSIYSPPFGGLYNYSSDERDLSNNFNVDQFYKHYSFVIKELYRITKPGRISAVHCSDIPMGNTGGHADYLMDLPGGIIRLHEDIGWRLVARYLIWKEPLQVRNRTMAKGLAHKTIVDDAAYASVASGDFLLMFRKPGENKIPIAHPTGLDHYAGSLQMPAENLRYKNWEGNQIENKYSHWIWRQYASCIWDDVRASRVMPFEEGKDEDDEKHVHPLQLDVIDRAITLRSNEGENIFTPFMGVGSEVYGAVALNRKGIGVELKDSYYKQAVKNLTSCEPGCYIEKNKQISLF